MRAKRIAVVGVVGAALFAGSLAATTAVVTSAASGATSCSGATDDPWPSWVQGQPGGIDPRTTSAIYMWHDNGWHIRVTHHTTNMKTFSGQLSTSGSFSGAKPNHLEKGDQFQVSADKHTITFLFHNYGGIDGLNFFTHCAPSINFAFQSDGRTSPPSKIVIGRSATHPASDPFSISRPVSTTTTTSACGGVTDDPWPSWTQGRPAGIDPRTTSAIYMWHDDGWHIRVTHRTTNVRTFSGQLHTSGNFTGAKPNHLEKSDQFQVSSDKHTITFLFHNYGQIDGLDFFTHCAPSITFAFQSDGKTSPPSKIVIGRNGVHPPSDPFVASRNSTGPTAASR